MPNSLDDWLAEIRLTDLKEKLKEQGYTTLEKILELTLEWEDLEEIGIKKLGKFNFFGCCCCFYGSSCVGVCVYVFKC